MEETIAEKGQVENEVNAAMAAVEASQAIASEPKKRGRKKGSFKSENCPYCGQKRIVK